MSGSTLGKGNAADVTPTRNFAAENPEGRRLDCTLLLSSVRGFSAWSEKLSPAILVQLLNSYLDRMAAVAMHSAGRMDRYLSESIVAIFETSHPDRALHACNAAMEMAREFRRLQADWSEFRVAPLAIDIGITSGPVVIGDIEVGNRGATNVFGEAVNRARHMEGLNREYGTHILLDEATYHLVEETLPHLREIDHTQIRNRPEPLRVYDLMLAEDYPHMDWLGEFQRGYELFRADLRPQARTVFKTLAEQVQDPVSRYYLDRCVGPRRRRGD